MKGIAIRFVAAAALMALGAVPAFSGKPERESKKVAVCHVGDSEEGHVISISEAALPAHEAHGDYTVEDLSPGSACPAEAPTTSN